MIRAQHVYTPEAIASLKTAPPIPPRKRSAVLNMRTTPELYEAVAASAERHSLSVSQEVERRLRQSFDFDDMRAIIQRETGA